MEGDVVRARTKIVCTLGPASRGVETLTRMAEAGMNVARLNSGYCELDDIAGYVQELAEAGKRAGRNIGVMLDLQGPRLRVGSIQGSEAELVDGQDFTITTEQKRGDAERVSVSYPGLTEDLQPGSTILIGDGLIRLEVKDIVGPEIRCVVDEGGILTQGRGMNFPGSNLKLPSFTERDRLYMEAGLKAGVDWISQSFVRRAEDITALRAAISELGYRTPVMAKIEKGEAVTNIDEILGVVQGIMVARGDLAVETSPEDVPLMQKTLIEKALRTARPVVTATQMLESMVSEPRPTRAEASDVANAILDGTDAVMLSAETAIGAHPVDVVKMMARIAAKAEGAIDYEGLLEERGRWSHMSAPDSLGYAACKIASDLDAAAIVTVTRTGYTARLVARYRSKSALIVAAADESAIDRSAVLWGATGFVVPFGDGLQNTIAAVVQEAKRRGLFAAGDTVVVVGSLQQDRPGTTNTIYLHHVE